MFEEIQKTCQKLEGEFDSIPAWRKEILQKIAVYISDKKSQNSLVQLVYICTHNSRRSHFGQIW